LPQGQIIPQQLHNQGAVLVILFIYIVDIGNGLIERLNKISRLFQQSGWLVRVAAGFRSRILRCSGPDPVGSSSLALN